MRYEMEINNRAFSAIKDGKKRIEIRTKTLENNFDYGKLEKDDIIKFISFDKEILECVVEEVKWYSSIEELLMVEGTRYTLSSTDNYEEGIKSINSLTGYSEGIKENGVYAIHIKLIDDPYIVAVTMCNKESVASKICSVILSKHLAASCQIYKTNSFYWWNDELEKGTEYRLEFRTKKSLYNRIEEEIRKVHDYEVAEIMYYTINSTNNDFLEWIDKEAISDK